jgi:phospholipase C
LLLAKAQDRQKWSAENFEQLPAHEQALHKKAFITNQGHPDYRQLSTLEYDDNGTPRKMIVPKSDPLYQFRKDVTEGKLPTVSWVVGSENFSDHPGAPWYGAWYVSEVMDILTSQPEVWKKTIFILCYDENDGYFDHVPPFVAPHPSKPDSGKVSTGIDTAHEYVTLEQDLKMRGRKAARESSIGLGFRVPLVIASPWSRGGAVCSEVFDHTSILQFLENFCSAKSGKSVKETNITAWRRAVCGDLSSVFRPYEGQKINLPAFLEKDAFYESIHKAQFRKYPDGFIRCTEEEVKGIRADSKYKNILPRQEKGQRTSLPLNYELYADISLSNNRKNISVALKTGNEFFGDRSLGAPYVIYAAGQPVRNYALVPGDQLTDEWSLDQFPGDQYSLQVYAPNGFYRGATGSSKDPELSIALQYQSDGSAVLHCGNRSRHALQVTIEDKGYGRPSVQKIIPAGRPAEIKLGFRSSQNWYDFMVTIKGFSGFSRHFAGRIENGNVGKTDPQIGRS